MMSIDPSRSNRDCEKTSDSHCWRWNDRMALMSIRKWNQQLILFSSLVRSKKKSWKHDACFSYLPEAGVCVMSLVPLSVSAFTCVTHTTVVWFTSTVSPVIDRRRRHLSEVAHLLCQKAQPLNSVNPWGMFCLLKFCHVCCCWPKDAVFVCLFVFCFKNHWRTVSLQTMKTPKQELNSEQSKNRDKTISQQLTHFKWMQMWSFVNSARQDVPLPLACELPSCTLN